MSKCNFVTLILETDCVGDSRITINNNFTNLDSALCDQVTLGTALSSQTIALSAAIPISKSISKAWINFNGIGTVNNNSIRASYNIQSVNRIPGVAVGGYRITFTNSMADIGYTILGNVVDSDNTGATVGQIWSIYRNASLPKNQNTFDFYVIYNQGNIGGISDSPEISLTIFGN